MSEEKKELTKKLYQIRKWFFENRNALKENEITVAYAFADKSRNQMSVFSGGKAREIGVTCTGMICELIDSIDDERDLRKLFNLTAGKIFEKFEEKMKEEGYIDDDE